MKEIPHILSQPERQKVRDIWDGHPLFIVCETVFFDREVRLDSADISAEDVFYATAYILDELIDNDKLQQKDIDNLWKKLYKIIRVAKSDASEHDKRQVAHTVFAIVQNALCHHWRTLYYDTYFEMLGRTIDEETKTSNIEEKERFVDQLIKDGSLLADWITDYEGHLSGEIEYCIGGKKEDAPQDIFHDNLNETQIVSALIKIDRNGCGPKQFIFIVKEFFEEIGWLKTRIDTVFVSWIKKNSIATMKADGLTHVSRTPKMEILKITLKGTFQFLNGRQQWEDKNEFYKPNRIKINKG